MPKVRTVRRQSAKPNEGKTGKRPPAGSKERDRGAAAGKSRGKRKPQRQKLIRLTLDQKLDIIGVLLVLTGIAILLALLPGAQSEFTAIVLNLLRGAVGWGVYPVPFGLIAVGLWLLVRHFGDRVPRLPPERGLGILLAWLAALPTLHMLAMALGPAAPAGTDQGIWLADQGRGGGYIGLWIQQALVKSIDVPGAAAALVAWWLIALALSLGTSVANVVVVPLRALRGLRRSGVASGAQSPVPPARIIGEPSSFTPDRPIPGGAPAAPRTARQLPLPRPGQGGDTPAATPGKLTGTAPGAPARPAPPPPEAPPPAPPPQPGAIPHAVIIGSEQPWELPGIADILEEGATVSTNDEFDHQRAEIIEHTLASFGLPVSVMGWNRGPAITQFEVKPGFIEGRGGKMTKVKVSRIAALSDDLALALAAPTLRIEAPIPGRDVVGVEVPNERTEIVALRDIIESETAQAISSKLMIALGADVSGQAAAADLARMPHLLIAGTTGSGKSVCVNAIITCLLLRNTPEELKLIMVDPKRVELTNYNGIPHLIAPVVVDLERVVGVLQWVTREMDERYHKFAKIGARNIDDHNAKAPAKGEAKLPYIVVVIDELADLMMLAPEDTERTICRLAQMARATGIHLIIATQRPSVDVITGLIKANFPARIAFAVASSVDSRVILDGPGAERLLGRGDMLFMSPESGQPVRLQGCWVADREIGKLVRYWKNARGLELETPEVPPVPMQPPLWEELQALDAARQAEQAAGSEDELLQDAVSVVRSSGKASISLLQRRLRIGYTRAARLIDLLEEKGVVGPAKEGSLPRDVLPPRQEGGAGSGTRGAANSFPLRSPLSGPGPDLAGDDEEEEPGPAAPRPQAPPLPPLRGPRPLGQNPPPADPSDVPPWVD